ncbi:DUF3833 domain-containing protein [Vibrio sp. S11_S32]|uniref:DUF3833 domain-containing protein n=1 Tax=Vibrio sp. S11_S32 TaxID=2720225 RepID=UPI001680625E|nr:DUF3833 domain-containing protein [Vibrio sp. S11_S32]MBD1575777.1 DUF3833 domain-containing protein [Vibrio sp. S11_S32]
MKLIIVFLTLLLTGCSPNSLEQYANTTPELKLEQFFDGKLKAYGMVLDRSGNVTRRFNVDLIGSWKGNQGELKEWFEFDDGEKSTRVWYLEKLSDNQYQGHASDVIGTATGTTRGSALYWKYDMNIESQGTTYQLTLDDWMHLIDEKRLFNKTDMTKFGFRVGSLILYIEKR